MRSVNVNELFPVASPAPAPTPVPSGSNPLSTLALVALLVVFGVLAFNRFSPGPGPNPGPDGDKQEQVNPASTEGYLFFVYEHQDSPLDVNEMADAGKEFCDSTGGKLQYRAPEVNDNSPGVVQVIEFAKSKGVVPPCVVYKNAQNKFVNAIKWPSSKDEIKKVLR